MELKKTITSQIKELFERLSENDSSFNPANGIKVAGGTSTFYIDMYPGLKGGAAIYVFGYDDDNDLSVLLINENNRWNPPQGFLNGLDKTLSREQIMQGVNAGYYGNPSSIATPLQQAFSTLFEETRSVINPEGLAFEKVTIENKTGQIARVYGEIGNTQLQIVEIYRASIPTRLPNLVNNFTTNKGSHIKASQWVKVKSLIQKDNGDIEFIDYGNHKQILPQDFNLEITSALKDLAKETIINSEINNSLTVRDIDEIMEEYPTDISKVSSWLSNHVQKLSSPPVFKRFTV